MDIENRPPSDQRRWLLFIALAAPIWIFGMMMVQRNQQTAAQRQREQQSRTEVAGAPAAPAEATPQAELRSPGSVPPDAPVVPDVEPREIASRATDLETVSVRTGTWAIDFTPAGAVPTRWTLIDARSTNGRHEGEDGGEDGPEGESEETENVYGFELIDPDLDDYGLALPFEIVLREQNARFYNELNRETYTVTRSEDAETEILRFESPVTESGLQLIKTFRIPKSGYELDVDFELINRGVSRLTFNNQGQGLGLALGPGLGRAPEPEAGFGGGRYEFAQAFYREDSEIVAMKTSIGDEPETFIDPQGGVTLAGLHDRYFLMGVLPGETFPEGKGFTSGRSNIAASVLDVALANKDTIDFYPRLELYAEPFTLEPGARHRVSYHLFAGPKESSILEATGLGLERLLFYDSWGWMRALCFLMMSLLGFFHSIFASWGVAIIAVVITVRLLTFPLTQIGMKHQANMMAQQQKLKPHLDKLNEKYKDNPTKRNQEMMKLYREHNVNPFGMLKGCMWMFIQLPIFFALYKLLSQDFDLRGASFLWIDDLSKADRLFHLGFSIPLMGDYFNLLPVMTAATQMLVSKLTMNPSAVSDPQQAAIQKQMMYMMPVMILVMTYQFPSGLCLYWMISNVWQVVQQRFVNRKIMPAPATVATT